MYPRLVLLQKLLSQDGAIFISIDDNEQANLKLICDEIFGSGNFITDLVWKHTQQNKNDERFFSRQYNHTLVYAKNINSLPDFLMDRTEDDNINYSNPDNDPKGPWRSGDVRSPNYRPTLCFDLVSPSGKVIKHPAKGWRWSKESIYQKISTGEIVFKKDESGIIRKIYLSDQKGRVPENLWDDSDRFGSTRSATSMLKDIFEGGSPFDTPKPIQFIYQIIKISTGPDSIVLDSFAGSGSTAHAVLKLNKDDGGSRKFIIIELSDEYADSITSYRIKKSIEGYPGAPGLDGDFSFYELGPQYLINDNLNSSIDVDSIRRFIYYTETKEAYVDNWSSNSALIGKKGGTAFYLLCGPDLPSALDDSFLLALDKDSDHHVVYAEACYIPDSVLDEYCIRFKKVPRDIRGC